MELPDVLLTMNIDGKNIEVSHIAELMLELTKHIYESFGADSSKFKQCDIDMTLDDADPSDSTAARSVYYSGDDGGFVVVRLNRCDEYDAYMSRTDVYDDVQFEITEEFSTARSIDASRIDASSSIAEEVDVRSATPRDGVTHTESTIITVEWQLRHRLGTFDAWEHLEHYVGTGSSKRFKVEMRRAASLIPGPHYSDATYLCEVKIMATLVLASPSDRPGFGQAWIFPEWDREGDTYTRRIMTDVLWIRKRSLQTP